MSHQHRLATWPFWITRWLGYRAHPPAKLPQYIVWLWSFIGAFCGLSLLQAVFGQAKYFIDRGVPPIIASFAASAVLCYGAIEAPLAQPRALVGGHFIAAVVGVCITKLFGLLHDSERLDELRWLAGSLATATTIVLMQLTETTHPPAGATALLAAVDETISEMGWYYLPVILLSSMLVLVVALIINNVQRRFPLFWFKPAIPISAIVSPDLGGPMEPVKNPSSSPTPRHPFPSETNSTKTDDALQTIHPDRYNCLKILCRN